ncbi:hypothetical protein [Streptomyces sp. CC208A]|uniref:hypothetical protein n=1 Tax=Streptomyces sp. CC208A TaxID=3044573 RepID=UPI0024A891FD|nr:hypothetical protein [Streptomyces sp. CC208A]
MSDENERITRALIRDLIGVYAVLRLTCLRLPIPINLPDGAEFGMVTALPAVTRAARILKDLPMSTHDKATLWWAAEKWLAAADALGRYLQGETTKTTVERLTKEAADGLMAYLDGPTTKE